METDGDISKILCRLSLQMLSCIAPDVPGLMNESEVDTLSPRLREASRSARSLCSVTTRMSTNTQPANVGDNPFTDWPQSSSQVSRLSLQQ